MLEAIFHLMGQFNVYEAYNVENYLTAYGLCVNPSYRGRGIATEILRARIPVCKALGISLTSTAFTGIGSQVAAKKAGYVDDYTIDYEDVEEIFPNFDFSKSPTKNFKIMTLKVD